MDSFPDEGRTQAGSAGYALRMAYMLAVSTRTLIIVVVIVLLVLLLMSLMRGRRV
jgi:hypothetical protein